MSGDYQISLDDYDAEDDIDGQDAGLPTSSKRSLRGPGGGAGSVLPRLVPALVLVSALVLVLGVGSRWAPSAAPEPVQPAFALRTTTVCPVVADRENRVEILTGDQSSVEGAVLVNGLDGENLAEIRAGDRRSLALKSTATVRATGEVAGVSAASVVATGKKGQLSGANCASAASLGWLVGLRNDEDHTARIVLTNPDQAQVSVNLSVYDADGFQAAPGGRNLVIEKQSTREIPLAGLVSGDSPLAIEVDAGRGRVAMSAQQDVRKNALPAGEDSIVAGAEPAVEQIIAAIPGGAGERELVVFNPGDRRAEVSIEALGQDGPFVPSGAEPIDVAAQSTASVIMGPGWNKTQVSLRLRSDVPIGAGFVSTTDSDIAFQAANRALAPLALGPAAALNGEAGVLALANPGEEAITAVVTLRRKGSSAPQQVTVSAGSSTTVAIEKGPAWVSVQTPAGKKLYGGLILTAGDDLTTLSLQNPAQGSSGEGVARDPHLG